MFFFIIGLINILFSIASDVFLHTMHMLQAATPLRLKNEVQQQVSPCRLPYYNDQHHSRD